MCSSPMSGVPAPPREWTGTPVAMRAPPRHATTCASRLDHRRHSPLCAARAVCARANQAHRLRQQPPPPLRHSRSTVRVVDGAAAAFTSFVPFPRAPLLALAGRPAARLTTRAHSNAQLPRGVRPGRARPAASPARSLCPAPQLKKVARGSRGRVITRSTSILEALPGVCRGRFWRVDAWGADREDGVKVGARTAQERPRELARGL